MDAHFVIHTETSGHTIHTYIASSNKSNPILVINNHEKSLNWDVIVIDMFTGTSIIANKVSLCCFALIYFVNENVASCFTGIR
jgi:hypothetical protein